MPQAQETGTPEYASFSEERRQVLGFILIYLERRNTLTSEYYKKLLSLNGIFAEDLKVLVQSIGKAKSITRKARKSSQSASSTTGSSFYELLGRTIMETINAQDASTVQSINSVESKARDLFQGLAVDQQPELDAIDATIASLSNQQHTMSVKREKLREEYLSSSRMIETAFEELKKRALIASPNLEVRCFSLAKIPIYEKALLDYSKKVENSRKLMQAFHAEAFRIKDAIEEIESKKALLKNKICSIEQTRSEDALKVLNKSFVLSGHSVLFDELEEKCLPAASTYLKSLLDEGTQNSDTQSLPRIGDSSDAATLEVSPPAQPHPYFGKKGHLEQVLNRLLILDEENRLLISREAWKLLEAISIQLKGSENVSPVSSPSSSSSPYPLVSSPTVNIDKSEYERLRISAYKNKTPTDNSPVGLQMSPGPGHISSPLSFSSSHGSLSSSSGIKKYVALYDSIGESSDELSFHKGDTFEALSTDPSADQEDWLYVLHIPTGIRGYVPTTYVGPM